jgi:TPR repeat protein
MIVPKIDSALDKAEQGDPEAMCYLGICLDIGFGLPRNPGMAYLWFLFAADRGNANAQCYLGLYYYFGRGVEKDINEALRLLEQSAAQGKDLALHCLGMHNAGVVEYDQDMLMDDYLGLLGDVHLQPSR